MSDVSFANALLLARAGKGRGNSKEETLEVFRAGIPAMQEKFPADIYTRAVEQAYTESAWMCEGFSAAELAGQKLSELRFIVNGILPEGLVILAGKPKMGKSWLSLNLALAISKGGKALSFTDCEQGDVLYLALEDGKRRLRSRLDTLLLGDSAPDNLHFFTDWPVLDRGGLARLDEYLKLRKNTRAVIIDTLQKVKPHSNGKTNAYQDDYTALSGLQKLAATHHAAILVVHHLRKATAEDIVDTLNSSTGMTGCADTILILERARGQSDAILHVTGRDVLEAKYALRFDAKLAVWQVIGDADEVGQSQARQDILQLLRNDGDGMRPAAIAKALGKNEWTVRGLLRKMTDAGTIKRTRELYTT
jgi:hypothetical protein